MDELFLKMHEEAMDLQKAVTELKFILGELEDAIDEQEVEIAQRDYCNKRSNVEEAEIKCSQIKRIIGMGPDICRMAEEILKAKEKEDEE